MIERKKTNGVTLKADPNLQPDIRQLFEHLKRHEGLRLTPYHCPAGKLTIGYGRNLEDVGITGIEADQLLENDVRSVMLQVQQDDDFPNEAQIGTPRYFALLAMVFQMGIGGVKKFQNMLSALRVGDYEKAADEALDSQWAEQTTDRALEVAEIIRTGVFT